MTLAEVFAAMDRGDTFHVIGKLSGTRAEVHTTECKVCKARIIRTNADDTADNNLDRLRSCNFG